jgi:hypothetical protein
MAKKLGCASCGGTMKKMKAGGTTKNVSISKPTKSVKSPEGGSNGKMGIYGIPQTGPTGPNDSGIATMKKGGAVKKTLPKAQLGVIMKTAGKLAKSAMGQAKPIVKKIAKTYDETKTASYNKKTSNLRRSEDWDKFHAAQNDKKLLRGASIIGGGSIAAALYPKSKKK